MEEETEKYLQTGYFPVLKPEQKLTLPYKLIEDCIDDIERSFSIRIKRETGILSLEIDDRDETINLLVSLVSKMFYLQKMKNKEFKAFKKKENWYFFKRFRK